MVYPQNIVNRNENGTEREIWVYGNCCVTRGFLLRTEGVIKWSFFKVFYTLGHISENLVFRPRNNQALTTFLMGSAQVLKQP